MVKGVNFINLRDAGDPVEQARLYDEAGADELVFLDISATPEGRSTVAEMVSRVADQVFMPLAVGGGIRSIEDMRRLLLAGADKISVNSAAVSDPTLLSQGADAFGCQCIVLAVDARRVNTNKESPRWEVFVNGGRTPTGLDAVEWAAKGVALGAGELLVTSMDRDGTLFRLRFGALSIYCQCCQRTLDRLRWSRYRAAFCRCTTKRCRRRAGSLTLP